MKEKMKKPSLLTEEDIDSIESLEYIMLFSDETFSQICARSCDLLSDDENYIPIKVALQSFCEDNPQIGNDFTTWYEKLIDDDELFRLDKVMENLVEDVRTVFDAKMANWISEGVLDSDYDTLYAFRSIIGLAINTISGKIWCRELNDSMFFKNPIFGKYEIIALDYADNTTLNEFSNPHSYNRFDVEALVLYAMGETQKYEDYRNTREIYKEVQSIVYDDPNRLLGETKKILEQRVKQYKKKKMQFAVLYAAAVIEWYLKHPIKQ